MRLLEINNFCLHLFLFYPTALLLPPSGVSCGWALGAALHARMFNITRAIIYAWRAGRRPHNLARWAELTCSTLRLVPHGVCFTVFTLNISSDTFTFTCNRILLLFPLFSERNMYARFISPVNYPFRWNISISITITKFAFFLRKINYRVTYYRYNKSYKLLP